MMDEDADLGLLKEKIRTDRGFNGHHYKDKCFRRRIAVRMRARGRGTFEEYAQLLDEDPTEYDLLLDALTINVTKFFRNAEVWSAVEQLVAVCEPLFTCCGPCAMFAWREVLPVLVRSGVRVRG